MDRSFWAPAAMGPLWEGLGHPPGVSRPVLGPKAWKSDVGGLPQLIRIVHFAIPSTGNKILFLVVDASSSPVQVGIPSSDNWITLHKVKEQALEGLFSATEKVLRDSGIEISKGE